MVQSAIVPSRHMCWMLDLQLVGLLGYGVPQGVPGH